MQFEPLIQLPLTKYLQILVLRNMFLRTLKGFRSFAGLLRGGLDPEHRVTRLQAEALLSRVTTISLFC